MEGLKTDLKKWGFDGYFKELALKESVNGLIPARVIGHNRHFYDVVCEKGFFSAKTSGSIRYNSVLKSDLPAVGDWVMISLRGDNPTSARSFREKTAYREGAAETSLTSRF